MKPLTRYDCFSRVDGASCYAQMEPWQHGNYYAKDEADARFAKLEATIDAAVRSQSECMDIARKRIAELIAAYDGMCAVSVAQTRAIAELEAERDAARADAERWRWALENCVAFQAVFKDAAGMIQAMDWECGGDEKLGAAIDAARGAP